MDVGGQDARIDFAITATDVSGVNSAYFVCSDDTWTSYFSFSVNVYENARSYISATSWSTGGETRYFDNGYFEPSGPVGSDKSFTVEGFTYLKQGSRPGVYDCELSATDWMGNRTHTSNGLDSIEVLRTPEGQPSPPTSVSYTPTNPTSGALSWSPPVELGSPNLENYVTEISENGTSWSFISGGVVPKTQTSLDITNLKEGTRYWLRVRGENGGTVGQDARYMNLNWGVVEFTTPQATAPDAPTNLVVSNVATNSFRLAWSAPAYSGGRDINNFTVEYSTNNGDTWRNAKAVNAPNSTSLFFNVTTAAPATRYLIRVAAVNVIGASQYLTGEARTLATVPTAPRTLTVSNLSNTSLTISWILPSSNGGANITDYKVEYAVGTSNTWTEISHTPFVDLAFDVNSLRSNQAYRFRVSAINEGGTGAASNIVSVTTLAGPPQEPTNLTASRVTATGASLAWRAPTNTGGARITDYQVELSSDGGVSWSTVSKRVSNSTRLALNGLAPVTTYQVRVSAVNRAGTGAAVTGSFTTLAGPPSAPTNLRSSDVTGTTATIAWDLPASNGGSPITNYRVEVSSNCKNYTVLPRTASNSLAHNVTNLQPGVRFCFRVSTINAVGTSSASTVLELTTVGNAPNAPTSLGFTARPTQVTLSWNAATVTGGGPVRNYLVEYSTNGGTNWINVTKPVSTSRTLVIRNLTRSTAYLFRVYAVNDSGTSPSSANLAVTTPAR